MVNPGMEAITWQILALGHLVTCKASFATMTTTSSTAFFFPPAIQVISGEDSYSKSWKENKKSAPDYLATRNIASETSERREASFFW